jgi:hypothetical protein
MYDLCHDLIINPSSTGEIWQEWEWIMSETEKFALRRTTEDSDLIKKELEGLRNTANVLKARPIFLQHAKTLLQTALAAEDVHKLATRILDSSKRYRTLVSGSGLPANGGLIRSLLKLRCSFVSRARAGLRSSPM